MILHKQPVKRNQKKEINEEIEKLKNNEEAKINQEKKENKIKEELNNGIVSDDFKEMYIGKGKQSNNTSKDEYNFEVN